MSGSRTGIDPEFGALLRILPTSTCDETSPKLRDWLDESFPMAVQQQQAGFSVDVRLYARRHPKGHVWTGVALLDHDSGRIVANLPLGRIAGEQSRPPWLGLARCVAMVSHRLVEWLDRHRPA